MELIKEINMLENKKAIIGVNIAAIPLFVFGIWLFTRLAAGEAIYFSFAFMPLQTLLFNLVIFFLTYFLIISIHELIHGLFFKVFSDTGKVKFGFKNGMAYATNPGTKYTWWQFLIIVLAPCVFISLVLYGAYQMTWINGTFFVAMASLHFSGCVGDLWYALLIMKYGDKYYEDTEVGFSIWSKE